MSSLVITLLGLAAGFAGVSAVTGVAPSAAGLSGTGFLSSCCCSCAATMTTDRGKNVQPPAAHHKTSAIYATRNTAHLFSASIRR
jgi:hypothetical protein